MSVRQKCLCMANKHGSPFLSVPVDQLDVGIVCTNIPLHSTMGRTNKLIYTVYTNIPSIPVLCWIDMYCLYRAICCCMANLANKLMNLFGKYKKGENKEKIFFPCSINTTIYKDK